MPKHFLQSFLLLLIIFSLLFYSLSQQTGVNAAAALESYKKGDSYYRQATALNNSPNYTEEKEQELNRQALQFFKRSHAELPAGEDSLRFYTSFKIGELEHYFENHPAAIQFYQQAIQVRGESDLSDSLLFKPLLYTGLIYYNENKFDSAVYFFKEAERIQAKHNNKLTEKERLFNILGVLYYETGNYVQANNYIEKALEVLHKDHPYYKDLYINYQINLGQINLKLEDYDRANMIYQKILPMNINRAEILHNIGLINLYLGSAKKALSYFQQVRFNNQKDIRLFTNTGNAWLNLEEHDSAFAYFEKALAVQVPVNNITSVARGSAYKGLGDLFTAQNRYREAISYYQRAINHFYPAFTDSNYKANPKTFSGIFSYINLFQALSGKANVLHELYLQTGNTEWAINELNAYHSAFELVDYVEKIYDSDEARLFLNKIKYLVHNKPIDAAYDLYNRTKDLQFLKQLYYFDQKNKASVLSFNQQRNSISMGNTQLLSLRREITRLSIKASNTNDSTALEAINTAIRDKEIELGKLQEEAGKNITWSERVPDVSELQRQVLDDETAILSYHLSDSVVYCIQITEDEFSITKRPVQNNFSDQLGQYLDHIQQDEQTNKDSSYWYDLLIPPMRKEITRLVIIPDDELSYLPFEGLKDRNSKFLIHRFSVQYQYATTLLKKQKFNYRNLTVSAFAPFYASGTDRLETLPESDEEIAGLAGNKYIGARATKKQFLQDVPHTGIFHLATHAAVNDSSKGSAYIAFYPQANNDHILYASEIYGLDLAKTRLMILSACETGTGELEKGEGVMSLSRAIAYAGCPNVITSLWKADDLSTSYIMKRVHHHLSEGESIDQALIAAKKDYLQDDQINPRRKAPAYWANLVFIGNYEAAPGNSKALLVIASILFGALILFLIKKPPVKTRAGGIQ